MVTVSTVLLLVACVLFILAGLGIPAPTRFQWLGWGLAFMVAATLVGVIRIANG